MDVDIISLISNESKEVHFNRRQYVQATDRGMYFEIPYSLMLRDTNSRRKIIQLAHSYHSVGKSKVSNYLPILLKIYFITNSN